MSEQVKIAYEKHPVTAERKAKLIRDGFKIIDIRFKPDNETKGGKKNGKKEIEKEVQVAEPTELDEVTEQLIAEQVNNESE